MHVRQLILLSLCIVFVCCCMQQRTLAADKKKSTLTATEYFKQGKRDIDIERYEDAIVSLKKAVARRPKNGKYHYYLGEAYYKAGYFQEAERSYSKAQRLSTEYRDEARYARGLIQYEAGDLTEARETFEVLAEKEQDTVLGERSERMLKRVEEASSRQKDWGVFASIGSETDDNLPTQFQESFSADQGTVTDVYLWYRPSWFKGNVIEFTSSQIQYQKLTSANITGQVWHVGSDMNLDPLFSYDYYYSYYWLKGYPYFQSDQLKLMLNLHLLPFERTARTGFFLGGEHKYYFKGTYERYDMQIVRGGIEQTLFNDALYLSGYYNSGLSNADENNYDATDYTVNLSIELLPEIFLNGGSRYEYRAYHDFYGYTRQDIYTEVSYGLRKYFWDIWSLAAERRNIGNDSNVVDKVYQDNITTLSLAVSF